jgi:hypothetical protein
MYFFNLTKQFEIALFKRCFYTHDMMMVTHVSNINLTCKLEIIRWNVNDCFIVYIFQDSMIFLRFEIEPSRVPDYHGWKKHLKFVKTKIRKVQEFRDFIEPYVR